MSGLGKSNGPRGSMMRCDPMSAPQPAQPLGKAGVKSQNREQHLGRSFPQTNTTIKLAIQDGGLRPVPAMVQSRKIVPKQPYAQPKVSVGQKMPGGRSGVK